MFLQCLSLVLYDFSEFMLSWNWVNEQDRIGKIEGYQRPPLQKHPPTHTHTKLKSLETCIFALYMDFSWDFRLYQPSNMWNRCVCVCTKLIGIAKMIITNTRRVQKALHVRDIFLLIYRRMQQIIGMVKAIDTNVTWVCRIFPYHNRLGKNGLSQWNQNQALILTFVWFDRFSMGLAIYAQKLFTCFSELKHWNNHDAYICISIHKYVNWTMYIPHRPQTYWQKFEQILMACLWARHQKFYFSFSLSTLF